MRSEHSPQRAPVMLLHSFRNGYLQITITLHQAHWSHQQQSYLPVCLSQVYKERERSREMLFLWSGLPNQVCVTSIIQHSHNEFSMALVAMDSLHMFCRADLLREHIWGFQTSGNPRYSSKLTFRSLNNCSKPSNLGRKTKYGPINSDVLYSGWKRYSLSQHVSCDGVLLSPPSLQDCIPLCTWIPSGLLFHWL